MNREESDDFLLAILCFTTFAVLIFDIGVLVREAFLIFFSEILLWVTLYIAELKND